jgi:hypothetical protein
MPEMPEERNNDDFLEPISLEQYFDGAQPHLQTMPSIKKTPIKRLRT